MELINLDEYMSNMTNLKYLEQNGGTNVDFMYKRNDYLQNSNDNFFYT
jgi:hypothetical protein